MNRREFLTGTMAAAFGAALARLPRLEIEEPEFIDFEIDEDKFGEAITMHAPYVKDGQVWAGVDLDTIKAWEAVTIYAGDGSIWNSNDGGETFVQTHEPYIEDTAAYPLRYLLDHSE